MNLVDRISNLNNYYGIKLAMIETSEKNIHWDYYLALESDIEKIAKYIEFDQSNFDTHSIELARLLLATSSEVDVVMKGFCELLSQESNAENINGYRNVIQKHFPAIIEKQVISTRYGLTLSPWSNWKEDENPVWWKGYNKVKHERGAHFSKANLRNVLNSIAGLFIINIYFNHQKYCAENVDYPHELRYTLNILSPSSNIFRLDDDFLYMGE